MYFFCCHCSGFSAAAGWVDTVKKFGCRKLHLDEILSPAIRLAEDGYPVEPITAHNWARGEALLKSASSNGSELLLNGQAPKEGEIMRMPELAETMRTLARLGKKGFYRGRIAQAIVHVLEKRGGVLSLEDLAEHRNTTDTPIHVNYRGVDVYEMPPNGQGITTLLALNIMEGFKLDGLAHNSAPHLHLVIESLRLAFADTRYYVADPEFVTDIPVKGMLSKEYAETRRALINPKRAATNIV